jgi:hypothetical protein
VCRGVKPHPQPRGEVLPHQLSNFSLRLVFYCNSKTIFIRTVARTDVVVGEPRHDFSQSKLVVGLRSFIPILISSGLLRRGSPSIMRREISFGASTLMQRTRLIAPQSTFVTYPHPLAKTTSSLSFIMPSTMESHFPCSLNTSRQCAKAILLPPPSSIHFLARLPLSKCATDYWVTRLKGVHPWAFPQKLSSTADAWRTSKAVNIPKETIDRVCRRYEVSAQSIAQAAWAKVLAISSKHLDVIYGQVVSSRIWIDGVYELD